MQALVALPIPFSANIFDVTGWWDGGKKTVYGLCNTLLINFDQERAFLVQCGACLQAMIREHRAMGLEHGRRPSSLTVD